MSGKPGRPPEDRLLRQREIYRAAAPLIETVGARRLTMRQAAGAAHMSLGGVYHYFPTKRDLVLHALKPEAFARLCADFHDTYGHLEATDPRRYLEAYVEFQVTESFFVRPSLQAAMELGVEVTWEGIENGIELGLDGFVRPIRAALPDADPEELRALGRSLRRSLFAALLDRRITPDELHDELWSLIEGWARRIGRLAPRQPGSAPLAAASL